MKGPVHEWPLALCDADSVSPGNDFVANDTVFSADVVRENVMVHFNATHRWHYLSDQMPSELLLFRQVDSELNPGMLQLCMLGLLYMLRQIPSSGTSHIVHKSNSRAAAIFFRA